MMISSEGWKQWDENLRHPKALQQKRLKEFQDVSLQAAAPRYSYHYNEALKAGLDATSIVDHIKQIDTGYDVDKARKAGLKDSDIVQYWMNKKQELNQTIKDKNLDYVLAKQGMDNDLVKGAVKGLTSIYSIENDISHLLTFKNDDDWKKAVQETAELSATLSHSRDDKDAISLFNVGRFGIDLAIPVTKSKLGIAAITGALGYGSARADGENVDSALTTGAITGTVGAGLTKVIDVLVNKLGAKTGKDVYEYYKNQLNYDDKTADEVYSKWSKINKSTGNEIKDRLLSIVDHAGDSGATLKTALARMSPEYYKSLEAARIQRVRDLNDMAQVDINIGDTAKALQDSIKATHNNYTRIKWQIDKTYIPQGVEKDIPPFKLPDSIIDDIDAIKAPKAMLKGLLEEEPFHPTNLIEAMPYVNKIIGQTSGKIRNQWENVRQQLDDSLQAVLHPHDYRLWRQASSEYKLATEVAKSKSGEAILRTLGKVGKKSQIEPSRALEIITADKDAGNELFKNLKTLVGDKNAGEFEKLVISNMLNKHPDDIMWSTIAKNISNKGFDTEAGKVLKNTLNTVAEVFKTDDVIRSMYKTGDFGGSGLSSNLADRAKVYFASKIFSNILKRLPTKAAKDYRMLGKLGKITLDTPRLKQLNTIVKDLNPGLREKIWDIVGKEMPKKLEDFDTKKKVITNEKIYGTKGVSEVAKITPEEQHNIDVANLGNYMLGYIRDHKVEDVVGGRVVEEAGKYLDKINYFRELDKFNHMVSMKGRERAAKKIDSIIKYHTDKIIKNIEDDFGIKAPKDMVRDIIDYITTKYGKDC